MADIAIASSADGGVIYKRPDGSTYTKYPASGESDQYYQPAPYPIASNADGTVTYSDGSVRGTPNASTPENYSLQNTTTPSYEAPTYTAPSFPTISDPSYGTNTFGGADYFAFLGKPGGKLRQTLGEAVETASMLGYEQVMDAFGKDPETGFSERIAGGPTSRTYASSFDPSMAGVIAHQPAQSNEVVGMGNDPYNLYTSGKNLYSDKYGSNLLNKSKSTYNEAEAGKESFTPENYVPDDLSDDYGVIFGDGTETYTEDEYNKKAEEWKNRIIESYNVTEKQAKEWIPKYEQWRDEQIGRLDEDFTGFVEDAEDRQTDTANRYGELIRRETANKRATDRKRRNMFSALGSAESSAFIEQQTGADKASLERIAASERDRQKAISNIDELIKEQETKVIRMKQDLERQAQEKIQNIWNSIEMNEQEKLNKIQEVNSQVQTEMANLVNISNQQKADLLKYQYELSGNQALLAQEGNIQQDLLEQQYAYESMNNSLGSLPPELDQELQAFAKAGYSGPKAIALKESLKDKYPGWDDIIDGVFAGKPYSGSASYSQYLMP